MVIHRSARIVDKRRTDMNTDTIAAQATASGEGGVAIVRVSGADCEKIVSRVFRAKNGRPLQNRYLTFGYVVDGDRVIDEAMAVMMRAPHSYTREDVCEIQCHGSDTLVRRILLLLLRAGARMAKPGEFTCRAFLNGRIALAQAEAVMRMIRAGSDRAMAAAIDFPDEVEETQTAHQVKARCAAICARLESSCDPRAGRIEDEGLRVVLGGRPNAGKSSLLNALIGGERAIVTDIPGTTRDTLTEAIQIDGLRVNLTDTAGLRDTGDAVERIGVARARKALDEADVRVLVLDGSEPIINEDMEALCGLEPQIVALSKGDLPAVVTDRDACEAFPAAQVIPVCALKGEGLDALRRALVSFAPEDGAESSMLSQARHIEAAGRACESLRDAMRAIEDGMPLDMCAVDLSAALDCLGEITGETMSEQVIDQVFARFCVGK